MARKNLLTGLTERKTSGEAAEAETPARPPSPAFSGRGAFGAVTRTIDDLAARADAARALEAQLTAGAVIIEIDPTIVDRSFMPDRMEPKDESYEALKASIAASGQDSPILVRPHPEAKGRFQVAFGHRRLRAAAELGRPVRAVVKQLTDRDLVVAQGQENSARADLSFIERARFAQALEEAGYDRETIMQALAVEKTSLSRLITVVNRLPTDIIDAIGPAPAAGRDRWGEMARAYREHAYDRPVDPLLESPAFQMSPSDERFEMLFSHLTKPVPTPKRETAPPAPLPAPPAPVAPPVPGLAPRHWISRSGRKVVTVSATEKAFVLAIDKRVAAHFGEFLLSRLEALYEDYTTEEAQRALPRHSLSR